MKTFAVYMLAAKPNGTLYIGVTSNLVARLWQHRHHAMPGFTDRYEVTRLVWYEVHDSAESAIQREKQLKKWRHAWKVQLLSEANPDWDDLAPGVFAEWGGAGRSMKMDSVLPDWVWLRGNLGRREWFNASSFLAYGEEDLLDSGLGIFSSNN